MPLRYERKYLVPIHLLDQLRDEIAPFVKPDSYADQTQGFPEYTVRSIYLDRIQKDAVQDKIEGLRDRKKLRIRGYNTKTLDCAVFLEIKNKISDQIFKNRALVPFKHLNNVLEFGDFDFWDKKSRSKYIDDASRFLFNYKRFNMSPVNLIVYNREPYQGKLDSGFRITFDKHIRSTLNPQFCDLYDDLGYEYPWKNHFILEIKYFHAPMPSWAKSIVHRYELKAEALSKYVEGYLCHDLVKV